MSTSKLERLFLVLQDLIFKQIGKKIRTNALKTFMDLFFVLFEKVGCKFDIISDIYMRLYQEIVTKEITVAQISAQDHVLVIGSGSLPATPALIAQHTHAQTISIDKDWRAVKEATQYVKHHHLEDLLSIQCADGLTYPLEQFSIILVLYGVKKPAEMLHHLANNIDRNTRVLYRTITDSQGKIMDKTIDLSEEYHIKDHIHSETLGSFDSFLLMKK
jgi:tRNA A58 N-methylase Trm61